MTYQQNNFENIIKVLLTKEVRQISLGDKDQESEEANIIESERGSICLIINYSKHLVYYKNLKLVSKNCCFLQDEFITFGIEYE